MTAKEYLSQIRPLKTRISTMSTQLEFLKAAAECVTSSYNDTPKSAIRDIHKNEDAIIRVMEMEEKIQKAFNHLAEINEAIDSLKDPMLNSLIVKRYICGERWEQIAVDMFISLRYTHTLHKTALVEIEKCALNNT